MTSFTRLTILVCQSALLVTLGSAPALANERPVPFGIQIVDEQTGRGVPLVELKTVSNVLFVSDSAGWVAIDDPSLLGRKVYFGVSSHGYEFAADGFGFRGRAIDLPPGGTTTLKIKRLNKAERLYRVGGEGVYRDSVILGKPTPIKEPLLNAHVTGQDSVQLATYQGKHWWFWGDTNRQAYPLGQFFTSGATSELPGKGGLPADVGVDLTYRIGKDGFSRGLFEREGQKLFWIDGVFVVKDKAGKERMLAAVALMQSLEKMLERRLVELDDTTQMFRTIRPLPITGPGRPHGHAFPAEIDGKSYIYFADPLANVRVPATYEAAIDPANYEVFTCVPSGVSAIDANTKLDRDASGRLVWVWRTNAMLLNRDEIEKLEKIGKLRKDERYLQPADAATGKPITLHAGSTNWNAYRKKWVMIANQFAGGTSMLGEVYYLEADKPEGPWPTATKVVTHDRYSLYNPKHHVEFDQDGGRFIYFEGTYSSTFERKADITPRYDYNQVMYRLDLKQFE